MVIKISLFFKKSSAKNEKVVKKFKKDQILFFLLFSDRFFICNEMFDMLSLYVIRKLQE